MEIKRVKVIMLHTKDESYIFKNPEGVTCFNKYYGNSKCDTFQHLYFITDDEIKEGDWYYTKARTSKYGIHKCDTKRLKQILGEFKSEVGKIVATTDPNLKIGDQWSSFMNRAKSNHMSPARLEEIEGGVDISLPRPSKAFIEKYCSLGGIDEVDVEINAPCDANEKYLTCSSQEDCNCSYCNRKGFEFGDCQCKDLILKVNSHNEITIHPIKDSWSRKEVEEIVNLYEAIIHGDDHVMTFEDMQKRIKEIIR